MSENVDLTELEYVKGLQSNLRATLDTPQGIQIMQFLEVFCGWYDMSEIDPNRILIAHGKRQVLASLKTLMRCKAEQIVEIARINQNFEQED